MNSTLDLYPLLVLGTGLVIVVGGITWLRIHAFIALITAAFVVSLMAPGDWADKVPRVAEAFGSTAAGVGIVIALAAVIGMAMTASGAADRIVRAFLGVFGETKGARALMGSGFTLAIPVFFDTVFFLLVPLVRSMYRRTREHYLLYLLAAAICAVAHALIPPTPGPLVIADNLGVELGVMMLVGMTVALPAAAAGMIFARWADRQIPVTVPDIALEPPADEGEERPLPGLGVSLLPIVLPVALIAAQTVVSATGAFAGATGAGRFLANSLVVLGNPQIALLISAACAVLLYWRHDRPGTEMLAHGVGEALMAAGVIVLITCAGGAFGGALRSAELAPAIQGLFGESATSGLGVLLLAFGMASLLKFAQGSSTAAMIVTSAMFAAMLDPASLDFHPVYVATAIGSGSLVGSWMNDSGFWIFARMGGLTELETLKTWTPLLAVLGGTSFAATLLLAVLFPASAPG